MVIQACRDACNQRSKRQGHHAGLLLQRYTPTLDDNHKNFQEDILPAMQSAIEKAGMHFYRVAFARYQKSLKNLSAFREIESKVLGRMAYGLSTPSPIETGVTLHHTYGTPVLHGSALKGLAAHYCHQVWGNTQAGFKKDGHYHKTLFGDTEASGLIVFHDAWLDPSTLKGALQLDIMTVHHKDYYGGNAAPTDFDEPTPIPFLSLQGRFWLGLSSIESHPEAQKWVDLAHKLLNEALLNWGIGAKTSSGYGVMENKNA